MTEFQVPEVLNNYLLFCNYREECLKTKFLNLRDCKWIYPTTLLPLGIFIKENKAKFEYKAPLDHNVSNYIALVTGELKIEYSEKKSYLPVVALPKDQNKSDKVLECIFRLHHNGEILIVSRSGALYVSKKLQKLYKLREIHKLKGTLISIRIPYPAPKIDIYQGGYL